MQSFAVLVFFHFHLTEPDYAYGWTGQIRGMLPLYWQGFIALHARFDSGFYTTIAQQGYTAQSAAFLPLYPLLIRIGLSGVCAPLQSFPIACSDVGVAFVISNAAALWAALILYKLARIDFDGERASRAVFYFLIFPSAFFPTTTYSEPLFIVLAASSLLAAGILAMLTRATGLCLFAALLVEWRAALPWRDLRWLRLLAIPASFVLFAAHLQAQGLSFFTTKQLLFKRAPLNFDALEANLDWVHVLAHPEAQVNLALDVVLGSFVLLVTSIGAWRVRLSYGVFGAVCELLPFSSGSAARPGPLRAFGIYGASNTCLHGRGPVRPIIHSGRSAPVGTRHYIVCSGLLGRLRACESEGRLKWRCDGQWAWEVIR